MTVSKVQTTHPPKDSQKYRQNIHQKTRAKVQTTHPPKEKDKRTNNDLQNITRKTKDRVTQLKVIFIYNILYILM
jgi:protein subunit release factor B